MKFYLSEKKRLFLIVAVNLAIRFFRLNEPSLPYFDETHHYLPAARAYLSGQTDPNFEHPPLAKELVALGVKFFGDNPWGWRFFEVILGTAGIVAVYFLTKRMFGGRVAPTIAAVLLTFEFSWFTTSRIAIPEIFMASLLLIAAYFLYSFIKLNSYKYLTSGSVFFGFSLAAKWTALLFIPVFLLLLLLTYRKKLGKLVFPLIILGVISSGVYLASYTPYLTRHSLTDWVGLQQKMMDFHTNQEAIKVRLYAKSQGQRGYSPAVWPINYLYTFYTEKQDTSIKTILFFYNPFIFWGVLLLIIVKFRYLFKKRLTREEVFLIAGFLVFWLAWFFAPRNSYPYYWLAGIPFGVILLAKFGEEIFTKDKYLLYGGISAIALIFIFYYPLLSALNVPVWYLRILTGFVGFS